MSQQTTSDRPVTEEEIELVADIHQTINNHDSHRMQRKLALGHLTSWYLENGLRLVAAVRERDRQIAVFREHFDNCHAEKIVTLQAKLAEIRAVVKEQKKHWDSIQSAYEMPAALRRLHEVIGE